MELKNWKRFSLTDTIVTVEELSSIVKADARMIYLLRRSPMFYLTDRYSFLIKEICDKKISYSDISWAEGINANQSRIHLKDGRVFDLPFGNSGLSKFLHESIGVEFTQIGQYDYITYDAIEKLSRNVVYVKGCDVPIKIGASHLKSFYYFLFEYFAGKNEKYFIE